MPRATIRDVARAAGVSVSTVSRVFTRPELFRDETRRKVRVAAERLNYSPNRNAASLTTGRTASIGLVVPDLTDPLFPEMIKAAQHGAREHGLAALLADSGDSAADEEKLLHALAKDVDGLIVFSSLLSDKQIASVSELKPIVFANRHVPGHRGVLVDAPHATALLTQHLAGLGHAAATYYPGPANSWVARDRLAALRKAASAAGIDLTVGPMGPASFESGGAVAGELVRKSLPTGVMCFNDQMAMGVVAGLLRQGVRIPEQISVTGWGGAEFGGFATPALTTMAVPLADLGSAAVAELLLAQNDEPGAGPAPVTLEATLLVRASSGPARC